MEENAGIIPLDRGEDQSFKVTKFDIRASVKAYKKNLNTHKSYEGLRQERSKMRNDNLEISGLELSKHLDKYSEIKENMYFIYKRLSSKIDLQILINPFFFQQKN